MLVQPRSVLRVLEWTLISPHCYSAESGTETRAARPSADEQTVRAPPAYARARPMQHQRKGWLAVTRWIAWGRGVQRGHGAHIMGRGESGTAEWQAVHLEAGLLRSLGDADGQE